MIVQQWGKISSKVDAMSLRERALIFAAVAFLLVSLVNTFLLDPMLLRQKNLSGQVVQQQEKMKEMQAQIDAIVQARSTQDNPPQRQQINLLRQQLAEGDAYLKSNRERLVQPEKMAEHLRQLLNRNNRLQLVALQTLPVTPLIEQPNANSADLTRVAQTAVSVAALDKQVFKHGVQLTLRGNYQDLLQYLSALESLPQQMYWARAQLSVVQYPTAEITLILYTLSMDKTWLQV